jgi:periplasmic protein TonB
MFTPMKTKFSLFFILFAFTALTVSAQSGNSGKEAIQEEKVWMPEKTPPIAEHYDGGQEAMYKAIYKELTYPTLAKRNRVQGECIIGFTINEDGSTSNFKVLRNAGAGTGEEAMRVARLLKFKSPGYSLNGSIPIVFKL